MLSTICDYLVELSTVYVLYLIDKKKFNPSKYQKIHLNGEFLISNETDLLTKLNISVCTGVSIWLDIVNVSVI